MNPSRGKAKGHPALAAALKTLKRLQQKHDGVVGPSFFVNHPREAEIALSGTTTRGTPNCLAHR